jgi:hypothetical protein
MIPRIPLQPGLKPTNRSIAELKLISSRNANKIAANPNSARTTPAPLRTTKSTRGGILAPKWIGAPRIIPIKIALTPMDTDTINAHESLKETLIDVVKRAAALIATT